MKGFWIFLFCLVIAGSAIYYIPSLRQEAINILPYSSCDTPLPYKLGSIDKRFELTNDQVLQDVEQATNIWSIAEGKNLFVYSPDAALTINFVYDERQALDATITQLHDNLAGKNQTLSQQIAQYESDFAAFQKKLEALNATIEKYNKQGGAPPDVYNDLIRQQQQLNAEGEALNARARELNLSTNSYNSNVSVLNNDIGKLNTVLTQKPEEGLYNGGDTTITMYIANNKNELIHTLTHELGHSLGMQHVKDSKAIMYPYTSESLTVTPDDMKELSYVCRKQSLIVHDLQQLDIWIITQVKLIQKNFVK